MAITQVRAQFNGQWYTLTYNESTRTYQTTITPDTFSGNQPGGYYDITVEATNDSGVVATANGTTIPGLRLVVRETVVPTLTLVSPQPGYVTTNTPAITVSAVDNAGGSGINPASATAMLDGTPVSSSQISVTAGSGGAYTIVYTPSPALTEGNHTVVIGISDNDGNTASVTANYVIDTVPPVLETELEFEEVVVDAYTMHISGHTSDATTNPVTVKIVNNDVQDGTAVIDAEGNFEYILDLSVGENYIAVTATDMAGLTTTVNYYIIRLITDRVQSDVDRVNELTQKISTNTASIDEIAEWFAGMKGAYNATDIVRVNTAMEYINDWMLDAGYSSGFVDQGITWDMEHIQTIDEMNTYLNNDKNISSVFPLSDAPSLPESLVCFTFVGANAIEKVLVLTDRIYPLLKRSPFFSGEIYCGEV